MAEMAVTSTGIGEVMLLLLIRLSHISVVLVAEVYY
jgi:hypothetical protein